MKPKLEHYPKWLREYLYPLTNPRSFSANRDSIESEHALHELAIKAVTDPKSKIIFEAVLEGIRLRFKLCALEEKYEKLEKQVKLLKKFLPSDVE